MWNLRNKTKNNKQKQTYRSTKETVDYQRGRKVRKVKGIKWDRLPIINHRDVMYSIGDNNVVRTFMVADSN